jgi:hypothetical protein
MYMFFPLRIACWEKQRPAVAVSGPRKSQRLLGSSGGGGVRLSFVIIRRSLREEVIL